jgi:hypothetical protein
LRRGQPQAPRPWWQAFPCAKPCTPRKNSQLNQDTAPFGLRTGDAAGWVGGKPTLGLVLMTGPAQQCIGRAAA